MQRLVSKADLSDEDKENLSDRLLQVKKGMTITIQYFHADVMYTPLGAYETLTGTVTRIDPVYREIDMRTGDNSPDASTLGKSPPVTISFDDLIQITGDDIINTEYYPGIENYPDEN